jgi:hypothetical protein
MSYEPRKGKDRGRKENEKLKLSTFNAQLPTSKEEGRGRKTGGGEFGDWEDSFRGEDA